LTFFVEKCDWRRKIELANRGFCLTRTDKRRKTVDPEKEENQIGFWMTESSFARLVFVASKSSSISRPSRASDTEDPNADAGHPAHRRRLAAPPFLSIANTRNKIISITDKDKSDFF
jgi:hypothetical protein